MKIYLSHPEEWQNQIQGKLENAKFTNVKFEEGSNVAVCMAEEFWEFVDETGEKRVVKKPYKYAMVFTNIENIIDRLKSVEHEFD